MRSTRGFVALCGIFTAVNAYVQLPGDIIKHTGVPVGREEKHDNITIYVSPAKWSRKPDVAVVYLTDAFGLPLLENKLLADSFARAGFATFAPDIFNGDPAPEDIDNDGAAAFIGRHGVNVTDPIIEKTIKYLREKRGFKQIAITGYCFGGRYAFRFLAEGRGADIGYAAHPSFLQDDEVLAINGPASIAAAEVDTLFEAQRRWVVEGLLGQTKQPFQIALYSGTQHGFGTRANISDAEQKFGKEEAFFQAVRWFYNWSK
ncbi:dienelactone hydrolase family-domain-containing protein [Pyrenochaeta sp. MPI-SDFR-AT-0127]|nr:dienelactone hydrolase family-domain-containing protein [Pyrenochaeta sp. MPI-SDFR-AT-0127]